jgi:hypothetical protein
MRWVAKGGTQRNGTFQKAVLPLREGEKRRKQMLHTEKETRYKVVQI